MTDLLAARSGTRKGPIKMTHYPTVDYLAGLHLKGNGHQVGIGESHLLFTADPIASTTMGCVTLNMPDYHKLILREEVEYQYHLVGYGLYQEEAMVRLLGETIERYALVSSSTFASTKFITASYEDLEGQDNVLPWEYIDIFSDQELEGLQASGEHFTRLQKTDKISWLACPSLFRAGEDVLIPAQFLYTGIRSQERPFITGFSKGTAAHRSPKQALRAAIIEALEADAFMLRWFTDLKAPRVVIDDPLLTRICEELAGETAPEIFALDISMPDVPAHVFSLALMQTGGKRPTLLNGLGAGLEPKQTLYRTFLESLAIHYVGENGALVLPQDHLVDPEREVHVNLDSNVAYWANAIDADAKLDAFYSKQDGEVNLSELPDLSNGLDNDLDQLIEGLRDISRYGIVLDITPAELAGSGWSVVRVFFPELVQMSLPSFPYRNHPRFLQYGGVTNSLPHALP